MRQRGSLNTFLAVVLFLILLGALIFLWIGHLNHRDFPIEEEGIDTSPRHADITDKTQIKLYFGDEGDSWHIETRQVVTYSDQIEDRIKQVIEELLKGPEGLGVNPFPKGTRLMSLFLDQEGIAYIDLSEEVRINHPGGTWGELMTIYSFVNTIIENFQDIKGIKLLIMGKEIETLKGHIDTRYPLTFRKQP